MAQFTIEVSGPWADSVGDWRPAVAGTLNQSSLTDEAASTFRSLEEAEEFFDTMILPDLVGDFAQTSRPIFRVVGDDGTWARLHS